MKKFKVEQTFEMDDDFDVIAIGQMIYSIFCMAERNTENIDMKDLAKKLKGAGLHVEKIKEGK